MEFSGYRKISEDKDKAIMAHPNGHKIHLVKAAISPDLNKQLEALPLHQAEGSDAPVGDSSDSDTSSPQHAPVVVNVNSGPQQPQVPHNILSDSAGGAQAGATPTHPPQSPELQQALAQQAAPQQPQAPVNPSDAFKTIPGYNELQAGAQGTSQALQQQGNTQASLQSNAAKEEQTQQQKLQQDLSSKMNEINAATDDIRKGHINPDHYMQSGGAARKISTAIGLILGGISSGQTGQPNPALQFLNKQIENDLEAQKADMQNKHNLLSALQQQYGDIGVASNMYRAIRANILADQIGAAASTSQSQQAKAAGITAAGQIKQQMIPQLVQQSAIQQLSGGKPITGAPGQQSASSNQLDNTNKLALMKKAGLIEKDQYEAAMKEIESNGKLESLRGGLKDSFKDLASQTLGGALSPSDRQSAINTYAGLLGKATTNRYNQEEAKNTIQALLPGMFESQGTRDKKFKRIDDLINAEKSDKAQKAVNLTDEGGQTPKTVRVISPHGQVGTIPHENLQKALAQGYKPAQ